MFDKADDACLPAIKLVPYKTLLQLNCLKNPSRLYSLMMK